LNVVIERIHQDVRQRCPGRFLQRRYDDGVAFDRYEGVIVLPPGTAVGPLWNVTPGNGAGGVTTDGTGAGGGAGGSGVKVGAGSNVPGCCASATAGSASAPARRMTAIVFMDCLRSPARQRNARESSDGRAARSNLAEPNLMVRSRA
jgi:hypothetical protein